MTALEIHARPRIAVIGAGISGLSAAWLLRHHAEVTLFEAEPRAGGHADTQQVTVGGETVAVDTGFIVYNTHNYPNLTGLFDHLGVATKASEMSFAVSVGDGALEYGGGELTQMFSQKRNVLRPRFWGMLRDITRFYRQAGELVHSGGDEPLGDWLARNRYGRAFVDDHILPMGAAIWSSSVAGMRAFPARHFAQFFHNHGLLRLTGRPAWRTVAGGSRRYVARMLADLADIRLGAAVAALRRDAQGVAVVLADGTVSRHDQAVLACHADQALALLEAPTVRERAVLGAMRCQDNVAVLHTDARLMPRRRGVWSSWNYLASDARDHARRVSVTYWMNRLQGLRTAEPLLVSLNPLREPDPARVLAVRHYRHPQFDAAALRAQALLPALQGADRLWFAGAWTGWGFHEDGIASAVRVAAGLGAAPPWAAPADRAAA
jgi:predicted NAD/FAD-binding protein